MAIRINIGALRDGEQVLDFISGAKELKLDEKVVPGQIDVHVSLFKASNQLDVKVRVSGRFNLDCDRCLDAYEKNFSTEFEIVFVQQHKRDEKFEDDIIRTYSPHMKTVDITNDIKEYILLTIPMRKVPEVNENNSCVVCGRANDYWNKYIKQNEENF